jgi:alcohol dehydrogenase class IV
MQYNLPRRSSAFAELAALVGVGADNQDEETRAQAFVDAVADLFAEIGIPPTLQALGLPADQQDEVAERSMKSARLVSNNPRPLDLDAMKRITHAAYAGDRGTLKAA